MSPALKGEVPVGSAEVKPVPPPILSRNAQQRLDDISNIVRLQAFEKCSDKLLAASSRLKIEAEHQSKYWDQMAELRSKGWPISRLPRDSRTLVAHVASTEAAPRYRNKGLIPFRRDENGDLTILNTQGTGKQRRLTVSIRRGSEVTGFYQSRRDTSETQSSLDNALVAAKEMIFEEELFSEASREAQLMANMGAKVRSNSIEMEISPECSVSIAYLAQSLDDSKSSHEDDDIAAYVGSGLRTMLIAEYENKHRTRSQRPSPPLTLNPRPSPEYVLVRPIIAQMRHSVNASPILEALRAYESSLTVAGLPISVDIGMNRDSDSSAINLQTLRQITTSKIKMKLSSGTMVDLDIETQLAPPRFGTQFSSTEYVSECGSRDLQHTSSTKAAAVFIADIIARDVCRAVLHFKHETAKWQVQASQPLELVLVKEGKPCAVLAASCRAGSLAVSHLQIITGITEKVVYNGTNSVLVRKSGQREETKKPLEEVVDTWVTQATTSAK